MPDKPSWFGRLDSAIADLKALPCSWVDRAIVEQVLGVGRRRAQQILAPLVSQTIGASGVADRDEFVRHLQQLANRDIAVYEQSRRRKVALYIEDLRRTWLAHPRVLVEAPASVINQGFAGLAGVSIAPGRITVEFDEAQEALEKLLGLAMAIGNDFDTFERLSSQRRRE